MNREQKKEIERLEKEIQLIKKLGKSSMNKEQKKQIERLKKEIELIKKND
jgi:hypothetical protein